MDSQQESGTRGCGIAGIAVVEVIDEAGTGELPVAADDQGIVGERQQDAPSRQQLGARPPAPAAKRTPRKSAEPSDAIAESEVCNLCLDSGYADKLARMGSATRPAWRHVSCNHGMLILKETYEARHGGEDALTQLLADTGKLAAAVVAVRPAPGTDLRTKAGKDAKSLAQERCKKYVERVRHKTQVRNEAVVQFLGKREYTQHWKVRLGCDDAEAESMWEADKDNIDIEREGSGSDMEIAVKLPRQKIDAKIMEYEQEIKHKSHELRSRDELRTAAQRMASTKSATDRMFAGMGTMALHAGGASTFGRHGRPVCHLMSLGIDSEDDDDFKTPSQHAAKRPRLDASSLSSRRGPTPSAATATPQASEEDVASNKSGSTLRRAGLPNAADAEVARPADAVAMSRTKLQLTTEANQAVARVRATKGCTKALQRLLEILGTDHEEVVDLEVVKLLGSIESLATSLAKVEGQCKAWKKDTYSGPAQTVENQIQELNENLEQLEEVMSVLSTIFKKERQVKTATKRKERRTYASVMKKVLAKLKTGGVPVQMANLMAPMVHAFMEHTQEFAEASDTLTATYLHDAGMLNSSVQSELVCPFFGQSSDEPAMWPRSFLSDPQKKSQAVAVIMDKVMDCVKTNDLLEQKKAALAAHMAKHKVKGNNLCFGVFVNELQWGESEPDELTVPEASAPWLLNLGPGFCMYGPTIFPLLGVGAFYRVVEGNAIIFLQDIAAIPGHLKKYMEHINREPVGSDEMPSFEKSAAFVAAEGDVFWVPYNFVIVACAVGGGSCFLLQQPWFSKAMACKHMASWTLAKSWQSEFMTQRSADMPWAKIGASIAEWMP